MSQPVTPLVRKEQPGGFSLFGFTVFELVMIAVMAALENASTFLQQFLLGLLNLSGPIGFVATNLIGYVMWGTTLALALRIAKKNGTATLYMAVNGGLYVFWQGYGLLWWPAWMLGGVLIDAFVSGRKRFAGIGYALAALVTLVVNLSTGLSAEGNPVHSGLAALLFNAVFDINDFLGMGIPWVAWLLMIVGAVVAGVLHFRVLRPPTDEYAADRLTVALGAMLYPLTVALTNFGIIARNMFGYTKNSTGVYFAVAASMIVAGLIGGFIGHAIAEQVRNALGRE
jgi:hypothetical protein